VVAAVVMVLITARIGIGDRVTVGAAAFLVAFLAVLLRADRMYDTGRRR
jgi:hypothetical protein